MRSPRTTTKSSPRSLQLEKAHMQQRRPNVAKNKFKKRKEKKLPINNSPEVSEPLEVLEVGLYPGLSDPRSNTAIEYKWLLEMFHR